MPTSGDARGRILPLFLLGIALPSGLLGYLALRGIRNDQALLERERRAEHERAARAVVDAVESRLRGLDRALTQVVAGIAAGQQAAGVAIGELRQQDPAVRAGFMVEVPGRVSWIAGGPAFQPDAATPVPRNAASPSWSSALEAARRREYQGGDVTAAYRGILAGSSDAGVKAEALFALARISSRAGRQGDAVDLYRRLWADFGTVRTAAGLPVGVPARLELAGALVAAGDTSLAVRSLLETYRLIVEGATSLTRAEFDFYAQRVRESAAGYGSDADHLAPLVADEAAARSRAEDLLAFAASAERSLPAKLTGSETATAMSRREVIEGADRSFHVLLHPAPGVGRWLGLLLDEPGLGEAVAAEVPARDAGLRWQLRSLDGRPVLASNPPPAGEPTITMSFASGFPRWVLEMHPRDATLADDVFAPRRRAYLYAFVLIAGILLFGLILTGRSVGRELELARMKADFVATVSHELRSPLTAIRQLAAMLQSDQVPSEERRRRYYDVLVGQSERLSRLVEDVLESARLETRQPELDLQPLEIRRLIEDVAAAAQQRVAHQGFHVVAQADEALPAARLDRRAIARALDNLVDNAIKYSGDSREILLRGFIEDGHLVLAVRDWGAGLGRDEVGRVFEPFYRAGDQMTRAVRGSGLGLTIVKRIVEAHGGSVRVESAPGRGSTFAIRLPIGTAA